MSAQDSLFPSPLSRRACAFLLLAATAVFVLVYLTPPDLFGSIDWVRIHVFYKTYAQHAVRAGRLPLWNPHISLGRPFLADVDAATLFYPPNFPYLILPPEIACVLSGIAHLALAGYGAIRLGEAMGTDRWLGAAAGLAFVLSAPIVGSYTSGLIHYGPALCYLPLVFALIAGGDERWSRRRVLVLGVVLGFQLLAGHPQAAWLTWFGAGLFLVGRDLGSPWRRLAWGLIQLACAIAIAMLLAAIMLLPLAELTAQSNRGQPSLELASSFAMPSFGWASLLVPSDPDFSFLANAQLYVGIVPLIAALLALGIRRDRHIRAWLTVALSAALLAAGTATPAFRLFYALIPGVANMRLHSRASVLVSTALIVLGVVSLAKIRAARSRRVTAAVILIGAVVAAGQLAFVLSWPGFEEHRMFRALVRMGITSASILALLAWVRARTPRLAASLLVIVTLADLAWGAWGLKPQNRDQGDRPTEKEIQDTLRARGLFSENGVPPRISIPRPYAREDAGMIYGWSSYTGYAALSLDRVWHHLHAVLGIEVPTRQNTYVDRRVFQHGPFPYDDMSLALGIEPQTRQGVMRDPDPRAYLVHATRRVSDHREATRLIAAGHDVHETALVESDLALENGSAGNATISSFAPERIEVHTQSERPALLVLAEAYYPGWSASVNGGPAMPCLPVNAWMRGVVVPAGESTVVLTFRSRYLALGATISLLTLLVIASGLRRARSAKRSAP